jgi:hypothetical protein
MYSNYIVRQDYPSRRPYSTTYTNITYGGRAFDGELYKPLPLDIELSKPDTDIYNKLENKIISTQETQYAFNTMRRAEHVRLSLDGKTIWNDFDKQLRHDSDVYGIIFHDYNLNNIEGARTLIKDNLTDWISNSLGRRVGMKYPVIVNNKTDLISWLELQPMGTYFSLTHQGLIDESYIPEMTEVMQTSAAYQQLSVDLTNCYTNEELINGGIQRIFRNIINLRSYHIVFPLIYNENCLISDDWKKVMRLIYLYNRHLVLSKSSHFFQYTEPYETLYSYCYHMIKQPDVKKDSIFTKESIQSIFQFVRENDYELFKDFYEYRGGEVKNDR